MTGGNSDLRFSISAFFAESSYYAFELASVPNQAFHIKANKPLHDAQWHQLKLEGCAQAQWCVYRFASQNNEMLKQLHQVSV